MECSRITETLYLGTTPKPEDYDYLRNLGITLVINMRVEQRPFPDPHNPELPSLWFRTFDSPIIPIPMRLLEKGVHAALEEIEKGDKVFVHCYGGRHRSVALAACILIAEGKTPEQAMTLIKEQHQKADPDIWYIRNRIMKFAKRWDHPNR
jgi:protein-tyrosine phosphatase